MRSIVLLVIAVVLLAATFYAVRPKPQRTGNVAGDAPAAAGSVTPNGLAPPQRLPHRAPPPPTGEDDDTNAQPPPRSRTVESVEARAAKLASREPLTRTEVRAMLEEGLGAMIGDRRLSDADYEQLTTDTMRVRAAHRVLRRIDPSTASAELLARERDALGRALADFERITGLAPSELTQMLEPDVGLSRDDQGANTGDVTDELLSDHPPPR